MNQKSVLVNQKHVRGNDMMGSGLVGHHRSALDSDGGQDFLLRKRENKGLWEFGESNLQQMGLNQQCADLSNIEKN